MTSYLLRRLSHAIIILIGVTIITFGLLFILPTDPAREVAGRSATPEMIANVRAQLGLNKPFIVQYGNYMDQLVHGNLGKSYVKRVPVASLILPRLPATLLLMLGGICCELLIGLPIGVLSAIRRDKLADRSLMIASFTAVSTPQFVAGLILLQIIAVSLHWLPIGGYGSFANLVLPALTLGILGAGWYSRMLRSSMIDVLQEDFVRTARAKGLGRFSILARHVVPNAVLPVIAMVGIDIGVMMGGVVVVETVFGWPGIGQLAWQSIQTVDMPVIMGVTLISAIAVILGNLVADLAAMFIDPRIRIK